MPESARPAALSSMPPADRPAVYRLAMPLALAVVFLLFAQWPLRELSGGGVLANDIAQLLFALYVAVAVPWASVRGAHLTAHPEALARARWRRIGAALVPLPWCAWVLVAAAAPTWQSVRTAESFPESFSPGYFLIRVALMLLAALLAWQCARELRAARR
jgi:hypothetical protein